MSFSSSHRQYPETKINQDILVGVEWTAFGLGAIFFAARIGVRIKVFRRLYVDDGLVLAALLFLLLNAILAQVGRDSVELSYAVISGQINPPPADFPKRTEEYLRETIATIIFFFSGLWAIKLSFLVFFKRLGQNVRHQKPVWWTALAITGTTYLVCLGTIDYRCLGGPYSYIKTFCSTPERLEYQTNATHLSMSMDVLSDVFIILVPINMLWKVQISLRQKLALACIFSITIFVMVFAIIRGALISPFNPQSDAAWLFLWSSIESFVSIMVACLASFRALFARSSSQTRRQLENGMPKAGKNTSSRVATLFSRNLTGPTKDSTEEIDLQRICQPVQPSLTSITASTKESWQRYSKDHSDSQDQIFELDRVYVRHEIDVDYAWV